MIEKIIEERCDGCGWCPLACRMDLIRIDRKKKKAFFTDPGNCVVCYACVTECPRNAIVVSPEKPSPFPYPVAHANIQGDVSLLSQKQPTFQETCDVVIVGAGVAGLTAAIAAVTLGAQTTVFEKGSDIRWTNTSLSGGSISFAKEREMYPEARRLTPDEKAKEAVELTGGRVNADLVIAWRQHIDDTLKWLRKLGLRVQQGEHLVVPAAAALGARGGGAGLNKQLLSIARRLGCRVVFESRAVKLLTRGRAVVGVRVVGPRGTSDWLSRAVVLAAAGFQGNQEMLIRYMGLHFVQNTKLTGSPLSVGDGHYLAQEAGARLVNMDVSFCRQIDGTWVPGSIGAKGPRQLQPFQHYGVFLNKHGRRFLDEFAPFVRSDTVATSIIRQPQGEIAYIWDESIRMKMGKKFDNYAPPGVIIQANTIEELAQKIGYPADQMRRTIEEFNTAARKGKTKALEVPKSDFAFPLEQPPFYVIAPGWAGLNATLGGPAINAKSQAMDEAGNSIPGLYVAGEMAGGMFGGSYYQTSAGDIYYKGNYQVTTSALGYCVVFGRIAGANAASRGSA